MSVSKEELEELASDTLDMLFRSMSILSKIKLEDWHPEDRTEIVTLRKAFKLYKRHE